MFFFERDHIQFHYIDTGEGKPFIFLHGLGGDMQQTAEVFEAQAGIRFISMECRGHGETRPVGRAEGYSFDSFGDDVVALMDHLKVEKAALGGISMGAGVSLNVAIRYPERVNKLILSRPAWLDEPLPENLRVMQEIAGYIQRFGAQEGIGLFRQTEHYLKIQHEAPDVGQSLLRQFTQPRAAETVIKLERMPADVPYRDRKALGRIGVPTLVLGNDIDPLHPAGMAETLAQAIPGARLEWLTSKSLDKARHVQEAKSLIGAFLRS